MSGLLFLVLCFSLLYSSHALQTPSVVTTVVYVTSTICPVPPTCLPSTTSTTNTPLSSFNTSTSTSKASTTTSTTTSVVASPTDASFTIRIFTQDGILQKRAYHYVTFDNDTAVIVDDVRDAALFNLVNGYLISDNKFAGVSNATGYQVLQKYDQPVNVSAGWFMDSDRGIAIQSPLFTASDGTAGFCALPNGTVVMEITDSPEACSDADLAALPIPAKSTSSSLETMTTSTTTGTDAADTTTTTDSTTSSQVHYIHCPYDHVNVNVNVYAHNHSLDLNDEFDYSNHINDVDNLNDLNIRQIYLHLNDNEHDNKHSHYSNNDNNNEFHHINYNVEYHEQYVDVNDFYHVDNNIN
ncbi:hypothetical protein ABEF95_014464 [Exophiala dermatitidis]